MIDKSIHDSIREILEELSRNYGVDVQYIRCEWLPPSMGDERSRIDALDIDSRTIMGRHGKMGKAE